MLITLHLFLSSSQTASVVEPEPHEVSSLILSMPGKFSLEDGRHFELVKFIQRGLHSPSSFRHVKTTIEPQGSFALVTCHYIFVNHRGQKMKSAATVPINLNGNIDLK